MQPTALLRRFAAYLWPVDAPAIRMRIILCVGLVIASKAATLLMPFAYKGIIDGMAGRVAEAMLVIVGLVIAYAGARFGGVLFDNLRNAIFERVGQNAAQALAIDMFRHLHNLGLRFHLERRTGSLARVVERGTKSIDTMLYFLLFNIVPTIIELAAVCAIFWIKLGPAMVGATLVAVAAYIWFTRQMTEWRTEIRRQWVEHDNQASQRALDSLLNYETVKYFGAEATETRRYADSVARMTDATVKVETSLAWLNIGQAVITNLMMAAAMAYTVHGWSAGRLSVGDVVLVNTLLLQLFRPLDFLGMVYREIRQGFVDMEQMFGLIDTPAEIRDAPDARPLMVTGGAIRFEHVDFGYDPDRQILHDVDFIVPQGAKVAVVGHSGAGKSTLSRLLYRFYDVGGGRITIDGQDLRDVTQDSLRQAIGIVPQDTVLFNDSIGYNIGYGRAGATQAEIEDAARRAAIHDFIAALPLGYDTPVGERGLKLSGGEKQRVAIARTLIKNPPILILDEATSALDSRTEADIQAALGEVARARTTIVVAHRLSTIVDADEILVMEAGHIVERGTHRALIVQGGLYAAMWARQQADREQAEAEAMAEVDAALAGI